MKEKVPLRDSTMKAKSHWLELEEDGGELTVCLRNSSKVLGGEKTPIERETLESLITVAPGVIIKNGPLRFYRTENDMRVSFDELEPVENLSGFDRLDFDEFAAAVKKLIGEGHESTRKKKSTARKASRAKTKRSTKR